MRLLHMNYPAATHFFYSWPICHQFKRFKGYYRPLDDVAHAALYIRGIRGVYTDNNERCGCIRYPVSSDGFSDLKMMNYRWWTSCRWLCVHYWWGSVPIVSQSGRFWYEAGPAPPTKEPDKLPSGGEVDWRSGTHNVDKTLTRVRTR